MTDQHHPRVGEPDVLVSALVRLIVALDERYPDGPTSLLSEGLAIEPDEANMRTVLDDEGFPAA